MRVTMELKSEFLLVAQEILTREQRPLRPKEIVLIARKNGMFSDKRAGKTPHQTMKAKLSVHVRRYQDNSVFVRTGSGKFYLRKLIEQQRVYEAPEHKPPARERA